MEKPELLFHFSEDPTIEVFHPHRAATAQLDGEYVWAVTGSRIPSYWFPRQCPRATWWRTDDPARRTHAIEWSWLDRVHDCKLFVYSFDPGPFAILGEDWNWVAAESVFPLRVEPVGPLLDKHRDAGIELRVVTDLMALWSNVITRPGIEFSGIRLRNAATSPPGL